VKLSASIMAHPDRSALVAELRARLDRDVPVYWDSEGPASGNGDRVWRTARGGWELADPAADFHVLIQDDAVPALDFLAGLERALEHVPPDATVCPYLGQGGAAPHRWTRMAQEADRRGASFVVSTTLMWGVAICLPVRLIPEMIERANIMAGVPDDMRVSGWTKRRHGEVWYPWPSLVDHRPVPSITKHRAADRRAVRHHTGSALELDWAGPVVRDPMYVRTRGPRSGPSANRQVTSLQRRSAPGR
jgi:hypothetical protein